MRCERRRVLAEEMAVRRSAHDEHDRRHDSRKLTGLVLTLARSGEGPTTRTLCAWSQATNVELPSDSEWAKTMVPAKAKGDRGAGPHDMIAKAAVVPSWRLGNKVTSCMTITLQPERTSVRGRTRRGGGSSAGGQ